MNKVITQTPAARRHGDGQQRTAEAEDERAVATGPGGRIIVGVDDSPAGLSALRWAVGQARRRDARLVAVRSWALGLPRHGGRRHRRPAGLHPHVVLYFDGTVPRDTSVKVVRRAFRIAVGGMPQDVAVTVKAPEGDPAVALVGIARAGDLIVVGRGEPGPERVMHGSVSRYCRSHARCPVVVVPGPQ
jgi:nucleotide-binding universal stress UspA family protein